MTSVNSTLAIESSSEQLLSLNHRMREVEHHLFIARRRRRWSNYSLILGPATAVLLYGAYWLPWVPRLALRAVYIPAIPLVLAFCIAAFALKRWPGGPPTGEGYRGKRLSEGELELQLARHREVRKGVLARADTPVRTRRIEYREETYAEIDQLRKESGSYRSANNVLQGVVIIGSLAATGAAGLAAELVSVRWVILGVTFSVGIASGFMGYFKYKERSFYLQQTADAIESEWEALEVKVGRYKRIDDEDERLEEFVEEVHRLKSEQKKRQQNLEQPPGVRDTANA